MEAIQEIDFAILDAVQEHLRCGWLDAVMVFVTYLGGCLPFLLPLMMISKKHRYCGLAVMSAVFAAILLTECVIKPIFMRERPFLQNPDIILAIPKPDNFSFPSSHASVSFAASTALFQKNKLWGIVGICLSAVTAFSRVYLYVHFPSDVLVGAILGTVIGVISLLIFKKAEELRSADKKQ